MIEIRKAKGSLLFDSAGNEFINFSESTNILGHDNSTLIRIVKETLSEGIIHYPLTISKDPNAEFITSRLLQIAGMEMGTGIYSSSGSEASDIALTYLSQLGPVILLKGHYHGNTGQFVFKDKNDMARYGRNYNISFPTDDYMSEIEEAVKGGARSIIMEPFQVEGGIREIPPGFFKEVCKAFPDLITCMDEAYTGFGKTGDFFSFQKYGIKPDSVIVGKAIGGGIPLGLTLFSNRLQEQNLRIGNYRNGAFGSSSGNRIALALGKYILGVVSSEEFLGEVKRKGRIIENLLRENNAFHLRGRGMLYGIDLISRNPKKIVERIVSKGVLVTLMSGTIRISPPLNISDDMIEDAVQRIIKAIET